MSTSRDVVATTFYPTTWMAEQLLNDLVPVECPIPPGTDPGSWKPDSATIAQYQSAKLIVLNGAGLEKWARTVTLPTSRLVDTTSELSEPLLRYEDAIVHQHGPGGAQDQSGTDEHAWLDPIIAKQQASSIAEAVTRVWSEHADRVTANLQSLHTKFDSVDTRLTEISAKLDGVRLVCSTPSYNYLVRRYGWQIQNLDLDLSRQLNDDQIAVVAPDKTATKTIVLWSSEPAAEVIGQLEQAGVASIVFSTIRHKPAEGDFIAAMNANLDRLTEAL